MQFYILHLKQYLFILQTSILHLHTREKLHHTLSFMSAVIISNLIMSSMD